MNTRICRFFRLIIFRISFSPAATKSSPDCSLQLLVPASAVNKYSEWGKWCQQVAAGRKDVPVSPLATLPLCTYVLVQFHPPYWSLSRFEWLVNTLWHMQVCKSFPPTLTDSPTTGRKGQGRSAANDQNLNPPVLSPIVGYLSVTT